MTIRRIFFDPKERIETVSCFGTVKPLTINDARSNLKILRELRSSPHTPHYVIKHIDEEIILNNKFVKDLCAKIETTKNNRFPFK